jgi:hypothetical protein
LLGVANDFGRRDAVTGDLRHALGGCLFETVQLFALLEVLDQGARQG